MSSKTKYRVAIIGGGIVGMSVAYHLSNAGCPDVVVLEKDTIGSGTTSKSLGGFRHQYSTELNIRFSIESIRFLRDFRKVFGMDISIRNDGYLFLASNEQEMKALENQAAVQKSLGVEVLILGPDAIKQMCPYLDMSGIIGGSFGPNDGHADTAAVLQGYTGAALNNGVIIRENVEVTGFEYEEKGRNILSIITSQGSIRAEQVLICAGPYTGLISRFVGLALPVYPYPRSILVTNKFEGMPTHMPQIFDLSSTLGVGQSGFAGVHLGLRNAQPSDSSFEIKMDPDYAEKVVSEAVKRMPCVKNAALSHTISGLYEQTPDSNPIIGRLGQNLFVASGFSGHGFMHSPVTGRVVSELMLKGITDYDISEFSPNRFSCEQSFGEKLAI
ncbi:MAG: FAD-binding oxidoreductase [Thaumarchaeota archaeon]|nr:FAD-binding oxidoreductase [Nitrososphaerota archaeon]